MVAWRAFHPKYRLVSDFIKFYKNICDLTCWKHLICLEVKVVRLSLLAKVYTTLLVMTDFFLTVTAWFAYLKHLTFLLSHHDDRLHTWSIVVHILFLLTLKAPKTL